MTTTRPRRVALITGASAGIGASFARLLAGHGYDLALVARRGDRLHAMAGDLTGRHGVAVHVFVEDLADPAASARLVERLDDAGVPVDFLINNAGYGVAGLYADTTWAQQGTSIQVMTVAVAELTHRLLPPMIARGWGRIVNVSSLAGLVPAVAGHTLYAASKAFLVRFSESLHLEVMRHGIHVTALCPGFTRTEFHDVAGTRHLVDRLPKAMWLDADHVARHGYESVMAGRSVVVTGAVNRLLATLSRVAPQRLVTAVIRRNAGKFRKT